MFTCECGSTFKTKFSFQRHQASRVHRLNVETRDEQLVTSPSRFECPTCDFCSTHKGHFREHLRSNRHVLATTETDARVNAEKPATTSHVSMEVLEKFMKHQETMLQLNTELVKSLVDRSSAPASIMENSHNSTNSQIVTTNNTKKFNLNLYLNEECKSAMNMAEFIQSVAVTTEDLESIGEMGYIEGMSKILSKAMHNKDQTERPMQCTDVKRETFYVKKDDAWRKDQDCEDTKRLIQHIAHKNYKALNEWCTQHPEYTVSASPDYEAWYSISRNMCNTDPAALNKLVRHLAAMTAVEKQD